MGISVECTNTSQRVLLHFSVTLVWKPRRAESTYARAVLPLLSRFRDPIFVEKSKRNNLNELK